MRELKPESRESRVDRGEDDGRFQSVSKVAYSARRAEKRRKPRLSIMSVERLDRGLSLLRDTLAHEHLLDSGQQHLHISAEG